MSFEFGEIGESKIARWVRAGGSSVLPVYEKEVDNFKGPRLFTPRGQLVAPDMLVFPAVEFIEAKHKTVFSWFRIKRYWCTGIDQNHYEQYLSVANLLKKRIWLLFLHECSTPDKRDIENGCPDICPTGLYGGSLGYLSRRDIISHRHKNWGRHGMIYWAERKLKKIASLEEFERVLATGKRTAA